MGMHGAVWAELGKRRRKQFRCALSVPRDGRESPLNLGNFYRLEKIRKPQKRLNRPANQQSAF